MAGFGDMTRRGNCLKVSYGTFSCALHGFDAPLQIMTAILDYLRYLEATAGERAAAPATPDIDILTGIATRAAGPVEASMQRGGIVLRALPPQALTAPSGTSGADTHGIPQPVDPAGTPAARVRPSRRADPARITAKSGFTQMDDHADPDEDREVDDDLSRIFEETDCHLETSAASRRRNAIQHLRAALAATRAATAPEPQATSQPATLPETEAGPRAGTRVPSTPRRERDPSPARAGQCAASRRRGTRVPLRLWEAPRDATLPDAGRAAAQQEDFGAFVARLEPAGLSELIEAAAVYLTDIEGHVRFSRPRLMETLGRIGVTETCEDMICACDALLSRGRLRKCADGRYAITDGTGFRTRFDEGGGRGAP